MDIKHMVKAKKQDFIKLLFLFMLGIFYYSAINVEAATYTLTESTRTITISAKEKEDVSTILNQAIKDASQKGKAAKKYYTIKFKKASSYTISKTIHIYSYVTLNVTGTTLTFTGTKGNILMNGTTESNTSKTAAGYGKDRYMKIVGGIWAGKKTCSSSIMRFSHCQNVTLQNCVFTGGNCEHQVEVCAINGFKVLNCTFKDMVKKTNSNGKYEALQLDVPLGEHVYHNVYQDGTMMKNVVIDGCTFKNVPRGVGTHSMLVGAYHENIQITNNTFKNISGECIVALTYHNVKITGNTIKDSGAGIIFQYYKPLVKAMYTTIFDGKKKFNKKIIHDANATISNNTIEITASSDADRSVAIKVYGANQPTKQNAIGDAKGNIIPANNYYVSGVSVKNNKITTTGHGVHLLGARDISVSKNNINVTKYGEYDGIFLETACKSIALTENKITNATRYGIMVKDSQVNILTKNTIYASKKAGIDVYGKSQVKKIEANVISKTKGNGILVNNHCTADLITRNTISNSSNYAALFAQGAKGVIGVNILSQNVANAYLLKGTQSNGKKYMNSLTTTLISAKFSNAKAATLTWKKNSNAKKYIIEYSTDKTFSSTKQISVSNSKTSATVSGLTSKKTYYFRLSSLDSYGGIYVYGKYSAIKIVKM